MDRHPLRPGHDSGLLAGQMNSGLFPQTKCVTRLINRVDSSRISKLIEKRVARNFDRVGQSKGAVDAVFLFNPATEVMVTVSHAAAAIETRGG